MNTLEKFFSTEHLLIPAISCIAVGFLYLSFVILASLEVKDHVLYFFCLVGFLAGNYVKMKKIQKELDAQEEEKKKKKKRIN